MIQTRTPKRLPVFFLFLLLSSLSAKAQISHPKIDSLINAYVAINKFNGSALVVKDGKKIYEKSFGYRNAANKSLNSASSIFPIGSLSKSFTALVVLKLAEEKKLAINDPISNYIPDYPRGSEIQIRHLLSNSSGIYEIFRNPEYVKQLNTNTTFSREDLIAFFKEKPLDFEPGSQFSYSNSGFDLLGIIIEKVTGLSYSEAASKYIFKPLKMNNSGFDFKNLKNANKVVQYSFISKTRQVETKPWNSSLNFSSGGLYSTTNDLLKFYQGLSSFKIVSRETFSQATTPFRGHYGYGWFIDQIHGDRVINHGGNVEGATSYFLMIPEQKIGIILLNNITSTSLEKIGNSMYAALQNMPYSLPKPKKGIELTATTLLKYTGTFEVSESYKVKIYEDAHRLFVQVNDANGIPLSAEKEGVFFVNDDDIVLEFISKDDKVVQLKIKQGLSTKVADKVG
ncbi:serine hydrolase domain-containing protein [Hymenobacter chitinivorans]|uniref:CubicO group peptidase (Beta-lactamase class C family) n=1 Tax=Hymenobacter chitinivorans DSM 11115 TaxID=1121954 RepID=A0A2M9BL24_9BACT|nr:serine hydrolase domain-containing protein [Hymenobacter chitinivorans]PJJ58620.1 CubicO group peptidase (beta-lactamase class C family) [Hymenobacter chitinivorans DSM 11115]